MSNVCPLCKVDQSYVVDGETYSNIVGVEIWGVYDGVLYWQCPSCGGRWHRWPEGSPLRVRAEKYVRGNHSENPVL